MNSQIDRQIDRHTDIHIGMRVDSRASLSLGWNLDLKKKKSTNQRMQNHPSNVQTDKCNCMILLYFRKYHHYEYIYCHVQHTRQYLEMTVRHW